MLTAMKSMLGFFALSLAVCLSGGTFAKADDAAVAPAPLPQVGLIAVKSIDSIMDFARKTGLELPPSFSAQSLEQQFRFIGQGGTDTTRPIGIVMRWAKPCPRADDGIRFSRQADRRNAGLAQGMGGTPMPGHADSILMEGVNRVAPRIISSSAPVRRR